MTKSISDTGITLCAKIRLLFFSDKFFSPKFALGSIHLHQDKRVKYTFSPLSPIIFPKTIIFVKSINKKKFALHSLTLFNNLKTLMALR